MGRMLRLRPTSSEELIVKWTTFLAEFKSLPNLDVASKRMSLVQYYSIDTIAVLLALFLACLYTTFTIIKLCARVHVEISCYTTKTDKLD